MFVARELNGRCISALKEHWQDTGHRTPARIDTFSREGAQAAHADETREEAELRMSLLAKAIEYEIIPRLMMAHRTQHECVTLPAVQTHVVTELDVTEFAKLVLFQDESVAQACVDAMRVRGISVETIYLDLLAPVARHLGQLWEQDLCDFTEVTIGLGRLQQVLHETSSAFGQAAQRPMSGRRVLLLPCPGEQHTFGIAMVAEFFHRAGWDVAGGPAQAAVDPEDMVRREWFDVVGFSVGSETHLGALCECIRSVRKASRNPNVGIIAGGPAFIANPGYAARVPADAVALNGRDAPGLADGLAARSGLPA